MKPIPLLFCLFLLSNNSWAQDRKIFDAHMENGYDALAASDYSSSLKSFKTARKSPVLKKKEEQFLADYLDELIGLVEKRKKLGKISPEYTHKVLFIIVKHADFTYQKKGKNEVVNETISEEQLKTARQRQGVLREVYEAMSNGNFSLSFQELLLDEPITTIEMNGDRPWPKWEDYPGAAKVITRVDDFDTFMWCTTMIHGQAIGGASGVSKGNGEKGPVRGFMEFNPRHSVNIYIHEFFHVVEQMAGIRPMHGHHEKNRKYFPGWKGETGNGLNYYYWHFRETLPVFGWKRLTFLENPAPENGISGDESLYTRVGAWNAEEITTEWNQVAWDLTGFFKKGKNAVMFVYRRGGKALEMKNVSLWIGDKKLSEDNHQGWSGSQKIDHIYSFQLKEDYQKLTLRATVKGNGGSNSNGDILHRLVNE